MTDQDIQPFFHEVIALIRVNFDSSSSNESRQDAASMLQAIMQLQHGLDKTFQLAKLLIQQSVSHSDQLVEFAVYYGFELLTSIVRLAYDKLAIPTKQALVQFCGECCRSSTVLNTDNVPVNLALDSPLVLSSTVKFICEIFIRTYPVFWPTFVQDCIQNHSILIPQIFLNISEMINDLILPKNPTRRKEIVTSLDQESELIFNYFQQSLTGKPQTCLSTIKTLDSLFQWFPLNKNSIENLLQIALNVRDCSNTFAFEVKYSCFQAILNLLKRPNINRANDQVIFSEIFYDLRPETFALKLISETFGHFLHNSDSSYPGQKMKMTILEISVEIVTRCLEKFNSQSLSKNFLGNDNFWTQWCGFVEHTFSINNAFYDEILLKFLLLLSRMTPSDQEKTEENELVSPIEPDLQKKHLSSILPMIVKFKSRAKPREAIQEEESTSECFEYEDYLDIYRQNRSRFTTFMTNLCQSHPKLVHDFLLNVFGFMLGPVTTFTRVELIPDWESFLMVVQTLLPRITVEDKSTFEKYFEKLLQEAMNPDHDSATHSNILSCLSSMSSLFGSFDSNLIRILLECIFKFILSSESEISRHSVNLFIKLTLERPRELLQHFQPLCSYAEELLNKQQITHSKYHLLTDGLIILSNYLPEDAQQMYVSSVLKEIDWIRHYDFGPEGSKFFQDLGFKNGTPQYVDGHFALNEFFLKFRGAIRLLTSVFRRIDKKICSNSSWLSLFDYVLPFFNAVYAFKTCFKLKKANDIDSLSRIVDRMYFESLFEKLPFSIVSNLLQDRQFLIEHLNKVTILENNWKAAGCPSGQLADEYFSYFFARQFQTMFNELVQLLQQVLKLFFAFHYNLSAEHEATVLNVATALFTAIRVSFDELPLIYNYDFIFVLSIATSFLPRNDFSERSGALEVFCHHFLSLFAQINPWFDGQKPDTGGDHVLEIILETLYTLFAMRVTGVVFHARNPAVDIAGLLSKSSKSDSNEDEEQLELVTAMEDCTIASVPDPSSSEAKSYSLLNLMVKKNWMVGEAVLKMLKWSIQREKICIINKQMLEEFLSENSLNSAEKIICTFTSILEAITLTEKSESAVLSSLVRLFALLYEKVVSNGYSIPFNLQLSAVTGVDVSEWNRFSSNLISGMFKNEAHKLKDLRRILESLCKRPISQQHSIEKPKIEALFNCVQKKPREPTQTCDIDSSLALLFGDS